MTARVLLTLPGGEAQAVVTTHALERWHEFACAGRPSWWALQSVKLDGVGFRGEQRALQLLERVVELAGELRDTPPAWVEVDPEREGWAYVVAGDFTLVLAEQDDGTIIVVTIIPRGCLPRGRRRARNSAAAARRRSRAAQRRQNDSRGGARARRRTLLAPEPDPVELYTRRQRPKEQAQWRP